MSDATAKPSHTGRNTGIGLAMAFALYVLSVGPMFRWKTNGKIAMEVYNKVYAPLHWGAEHEPKVIGPILGWYEDWWAPFGRYLEFHNDTRIHSSP